MVHLADHCHEIFKECTEDEKVAILAAHPPLGAPKQTLSSFSKTEQSHGGETPQWVLAELHKLNELYLQRLVSRSFSFFWLSFLLCERF